MRYSSILAGVLAIAITSVAAVPSFADGLVARRGYSDRLTLRDLEARDESHVLALRDLLDTIYARDSDHQPERQIEKRVTGTATGPRRYTTPGVRKPEAHSAEERQKAQKDGEDRLKSGAIREGRMGRKYGKDELPKNKLP
ncbi:hypothetical protein EIP91_002700 [Steccherinum ochraceum]|uniref:Uncharacterized protein n=1 Tax=Steccherinum ochraceum TaxID=92696 RepID=A0A4R0RBQ2_9APHY|nr:hypothetical protein EIP91_002700 [Steccherinum ochraceum]